MREASFNSSSGNISSSGSELVDCKVEPIKASIHEAEKKIRQIQIEVAHLQEQSHPNSNHLIQKYASLLH
jgi:hypothetical protein